MDREAASEVVRLGIQPANREARMPVETEELILAAFVPLGNVSGAAVGPYMVEGVQLFKLQERCARAAGHACTPLHVSPPYIETLPVMFRGACWCFRQVAGVAPADASFRAFLGSKRGLSLAPNDHPH